MRILAINSGSSSLKFRLVEIDRDGRDVSILDGEQTGLSTSPDGHAIAAEQSLRQALQMGTIDAVAHRVVHGGTKMRAPVLFDDLVRGEIVAAAALAPLHNPAALAAIEATSRLLPDAPIVAVFDTGFHATMPDYAALYPIDPELAERHGIRRLGFHGLAHQFMTEHYAELTASDPSDRKLITMQLGSGCSMAAVNQGTVIDTTMGLTPLEGLMMETRSGDVDPSLVAYLARNEGVTAEDVTAWLNHRSGVAAIAGERDMQRVLDSEAQGNKSAALAISMFVYRIRKYLGAYLVALAGADAIIFGGGIGENSALIRARILTGLDWLNVRLDPAANQAAYGGAARISAGDSAIDVWVVAVDEAKMIALEAFRFLSQTRT